MLLVLPFSFLDSGVVSFHAASDFAPLGIGVELFFNQLISLALVFYMLGLVNLTGLLKNMYVYYTAKAASGTPISGQWAELFLVGSTLGAQEGSGANLTVFNGGMNHLAGDGKTPG